MITVDLFPTRVCVFEYTKSEQLKCLFNSKYKDLKYNEVGEQYGQNTFHHEQDLQQFYEFVVSCASQYLNSLNLNLDNFHIVIGKSWLSFVNPSNSVPKHNHADHHLSFTYYVELEIGSCDTLTFTDTRTNLNEPFYGAFNKGIGDPENIFEYNSYNCQNYSLNVKEGNLCIFPSKLDHSVYSSSSTNQRKCIAGDFLLVYKKCNLNNPWGLQPHGNWKYYETKMD